MKSTAKIALLSIATLMGLSAAVWWASGDHLSHFANQRILNQSAISAIRTVGPVSSGFELVQRIDTSRINDSHPELFDLPVCIYVFLDATDGQYFPGTLQFELIAGLRTSVATLHSSLIPHTFQRICFPSSALKMLFAKPDVSLRVSVLEPDVRNVARIVLTPVADGQTPAVIDGRTSELFLPHMIEVQVPVGRAHAVKVVLMVAFTTLALLIIFLGSASARQVPTPPPARD